VVEAISLPSIASRIASVARRADVGSFVPKEAESSVEVWQVTGAEIGSLVVEFNDDVPVVEGVSFDQASGNVAVEFRNPDFDAVSVGAEILIDGEVFTIIGLTDWLGDHGATRIFLPSRLRGRVQTREESLTATYTLTALQGERLAAVRESVVRELNDGIDEGLRFVDVGAEMSSALAEAFSSVEVVLGVIASISLAVAALNIVNTMYIATLERADEIAILKSLGMTAMGVVGVFLLEAVRLVGVFALVGYLLANLGAVVILASLNLTWSFSWSTLLVLPPVTVLVGVGGGLFPAWHAARVDPARLLR
jgi:putative ABC transport system permease protein